MPNDSEVLYNNKKLDFTRFTEVEGHDFCSCFFDFSDESNREPYFFQTVKVIDILSRKKPILVEHKNIWKSFNKDIILNKEYENCSIEYPSILVENKMCSFINEPYILLDGAHRLAKMEVEGKIKKSLFLVLNFNEFLQGLTANPFEEDKEIENKFWYRNIVD